MRDGQIEDDTRFEDVPPHRPGLLVQIGDSPDE
jgi:hypothetical protein